MAKAGNAASDAKQGNASSSLRKTPPPGKRSGGGRRKQAAVRTGKDHLPGSHPPNPASAPTGGGTSGGGPSNGASKPPARSAVTKVIYRGPLELRKIHSGGAPPQGDNPRRSRSLGNVSGLESAAPLRGGPSAPSGCPPAQTPCGQAARGGGRSRPRGNSGSGQGGAGGLPQAGSGGRGSLSSTTTSGNVGPTCDEVIAGLREHLARVLLYLPRTYENHLYVTRAARNYLNRRDPDGNVAVAGAARLIIEELWLDIDQESSLLDSRPMCWPEKAHDHHSAVRQEPLGAFAVRRYLPGLSRAYRSLRRSGVGGTSAFPGRLQGFCLLGGVVGLSLLTVRSARSLTGLCAAAQCSPGATWVSTSMVGAWAQLGGTARLLGGLLGSVRPSLLTDGNLSRLSLSIPIPA